MLETTIFDLNKRLDTGDRVIKKLEAENLALKNSVAATNTKMESLAVTIDDMDQYSRNANVLIHGIQIMPDDSIDNKLSGRLTHLLNSNLGITIRDTDIVAAHRVRKSATAQTDASRPPAVLVQFNSRRTRDAVIAKRKLLKGKGFSITEQLTNRRMSLLKKATELVNQQNLQSAWSHDGRILAKTRDNRIMYISSVNDLNQYIQ